MNSRTGISMGTYLAARDFLREKGKASTNQIQTHLRISYAYAADIMERLEYDGEVLPGTGNGPRLALKNKQGEKI